MDDSKVPNKTQELQPSTQSQDKRSKSGQEVIAEKTRGSKSAILDRKKKKEKHYYQDRAKLGPMAYRLPPTDGGLQLQKDEFNKQNPKYMNAASRLSFGKPLIHSEKRDSSSSSEFEDINAYASQQGFYKRNLNRYSQERWPFQPCLIGRP